MLMKRFLGRLFLIMPLFFLLTTLPAKAATRIFNAPHNIRITVKNFNPVIQETDLQIITLLKHNPDTNKYIDGLNDFNEELDGLISNMRDSGQFVGELGETILITPNSKSIIPKKLLLIGLGDEKALTPDKFKIIGRIAAQQAIRLQAKHVTFATTLREQGNDVIDLGAVDAAITEGIILTYDTEKKLQDRQLCPEFNIQEWVLEAGAGNFDNAVAKVGEALKAAETQIQVRNSSPELLGNTIDF